MLLITVNSRQKMLCNDVILQTYIFGIKTRPVHVFASPVETKPFTTIQFPTITVNNVPALYVNAICGNALCNLHYCTP